MIWFLLCSISIHFHESYSSENILNIKQGKISGTIEKTIFNGVDFYSFKGIPYAKPPTGELRFQAPVKHTGWDGVYNAHNEKPTCFQYNIRQRNGESPGMSGSEDCLYLNIFTPNLKGSVPVVVFDYNDNFKTGFNGTKTYSPDFFTEEGILVVTINHRLGLFGYLTTNDEVIPGNNGLRDFILGLQWVKENIIEFGGDPNRVTLMGNRGGAILIDMLLYSKKAKHLFNAAIIQSGTSLEPSLFYEKAREVAFDLGKVFGINSTDSTILLEGLQNIDAESLLTKEGKVIYDDIYELTQMAVYPFSPIIETNNPDAVLTFLPENGKVINDVPIIIGMNSREGLDLAAHYIFEPRIIRDLNQDFFIHFPKRTGFRFDRNSTLFESASREIQDYYLEIGYFTYSNILEYAVYVGDILQNYALNLATKKLSKEIGSPLYYYMFDFRGYLNENSEYMSKHARFSMEHWGATITDELCYMHLCSRIIKHYTQLKNQVTEQTEFKVLIKMVRMWTNFAKYMNPTPDTGDDVLKNFIWLPVNKDSSDVSYLHITKKLRMKENPLGERSKFWDDFIEKYSSLSKNGVVSDFTHDEL